MDTARHSFHATDNRAPRAPWGSDLVVRVVRERVERQRLHGHVQVVRRRRARQQRRLALQRRHHRQLVQPVAQHAVLEPCNDNP